MSCTTEAHEADKQSPAALAEHYEAAPEPWMLDGTTLLMYHCKRCRSTVCIDVTQ